MDTDEFFNPHLKLGGSVLDKLMNSLPKRPGSNYHIITDNFFTLFETERDCCSRPNSIKYVRKHTTEASKENEKARKGMS